MKYDDTGYEIVGDAPMQAMTAQRVPYKGARPVYPRPIVQGRKTGMTTGLPLGTVNLPAGVLAGALFQLAQVCQERFIARRFTVWRGNIAVAGAVAPLALGQAVVLLNLSVGQRSVLAGGAGVPVEMYDPEVPGSGMIAGGVEVPEGKTVTAQFQWVGPGAIGGGESVNLGAMLHGEE